MRPAIQFIKENLKGELRGAEIGVDKGYHAKEIQETLNPKILFLIDPWNNYMDMDSKEIIGEAHYQLTLSLFKGATNIGIMRNTSFEAVQAFPDKDLDFVYIDGEHTYEAVISDIVRWYPKVKKGGVLAGHDYHETVPGVVRAVNEFCTKQKINFMQIEQDWWFVV